ncbi:hypothetical protein CH333_10390 [candidate division WOR-3 bacterium JGI_Cruoil_03_44_89]|uniref:DUF6754 domain-containing protein n=1 Tax=candidate division WOR-3 bacterium JGI_Cruoil_03_44_89 TaxID=1973748 RepID=A0A235BMK8_UNCW3|nr:MAG: hypothetical protein CH333_10390 [candidate division WOR-3 bacterium JGI_Cruoil_03_44_89]
MEHATWTVRILLFGVCFAILYKIFFAKRGRKLFLRRLPGLEAVDEAVGRATELGSPILFSIGLGSFDGATFASLSVLTRVVRLAAGYGIRTIVPIFRPEIYPVVEEYVRDAYGLGGRPDLFDPTDIRFYSDNQSTWGSAVAGTMIREHTGAHFFFGAYGFESLLIAETGRNLGTIQIAATDSYFQIPFFLVTCDYTLIGEELYAASAYLSDDPILKGSVVGQDIGKIVIFILLVTGVIFATLGLDWFVRLLSL